MIEKKQTNGGLRDQRAALECMWTRLCTTESLLTL